MVNKKYRNFFRSLCLTMAFSVAATPAAAVATFAEDAAEAEAAVASSEKAAEEEKKETEAPKEEPKQEAPKEEPKQEAPKEEPKPEPPKEEPKQEAPKEEPKQEEPKQEAPKEESASEQATEKPAEEAATEKQSEQAPAEESSEKQEEEKPAESPKAEDVPAGNNDGQGDQGGQSGQENPEGGNGNDSQNTGSESGNAESSSSTYQVGEEFEVTFSDLKATDTKKAVFTITAPSILEVISEGSWNAGEGVGVDVNRDGGTITVTATREEAGEIALSDAVVKFRAAEAGSGEIAVKPVAYNMNDVAIEGEEQKIPVTVTAKAELAAKIEAARAPQNPDIKENVSDTYNITYETAAESSEIHMDVDANLDIQSVVVSLPAGSSMKVTNAAGETREFAPEAITSEPIDLSGFENETAIDITTGAAREGEKSSVKITSSILGKDTESIATKMKVTVKSGDKTVSCEEELVSAVTRCVVDTPTVDHGGNVVEFKEKARIVLDSISVSSTENIGAYKVTVDLPAFATTSTVTLPVLSSASTIGVSVIGKNGEERSLGAFDGGSEVDINEKISGIVLTVTAPTNKFEALTPGKIILKNDDKDNKETYFAVKATAAYTHGGKEDTLESTLDGITFVNYVEPSDEPSVDPTPVVDPEAARAEAERKRLEEERLANEKRQKELEAKVAANDQAAEENETLAKRRALISDRLAQIKAGAVASGLAGGAAAEGKKTAQASSDLRVRLVTKDLAELAKEKGIYPISDEIVEFNVRTQTPLRKSLSNRAGLVAISDRNVETEAESIEFVQSDRLEGATAEEINEETLSLNGNRA